MAVEHGDGVVAVGLRDGQGFASHTLEKAFLDVDTLKPLLNGSTRSVFLILQNKVLTIFPAHPVLCFLQLEKNQSHNFLKATGFRLFLPPPFTLRKKIR